jgi:hypothetical protein
MIVTTGTYRFALPNSETGIIIRSFQDHGPDPDDTPKLFQLEVPSDLRNVVEDRHECRSWEEVVQVLAQAFCENDEQLVTSLINN